MKWLKADGMIDFLMIYAQLRSLGNMACWVDCDRWIWGCNSKSLLPVLVYYCSVSWRNWEKYQKS